MRAIRSITLAVALVTSTAAFAMDGVVASIKPIHSLVAGVMEGVGEPDLLVKGAASPHDYALRPSDAMALQEAKLVFWVGPGLEAFLGRPLQSLGASAKVVELSEAQGVDLLPFREGGPFEAHSHEHAHHEDGHEEDHDDEAVEAHGGHGAASADHDAHEDHAHEGHEHGTYDMHVWLDPENGKAMVRAIEAALSDVDPANAAAYAVNARRVEDHIDTLTGEIGDQLADVKDRPFIVFHDAYQYFERRFGLTAAGSITVSPEVMPGADRLKAIHAKVQEAGARCVFAEPNFDNRLVGLVTEGTDAKLGTLDPEGASLEAGPGLYEDLLRTLATSIKACFTSTG